MDLRLLDIAGYQEMTFSKLYKNIIEKNSKNIKLSIIISYIGFILLY